MTWDLSALYTGFDDPAMEKDWEDADRLAKETAACVDIPEFLKGLEAFTGLTQKLGSMVLLTLAADADNEAALGRYDRLMRLDVALETLQSELKRRVGSAGGADAVLKAHPSLSPLAHLLRVAERLCAHTLPPEIEAPVLNMQVTGGRAFEKLRDELDANQTVDVPGMGLLTLTEARNLAYAADSAARKTAYEAEIAAYAKIETPMAACLSAIKGEALTLCALRGYESPLDEALEGANMQKETLDALWTATREFLPDFRRYLRAKARLLGHEGGLPFYDLFAPVGDPGETFTLSAARELLERVLGGFDGEMGALISEMFEGRRIDVYPRPGKQGGAFCSGVCPAGVSYILANFDGSMNAVSTLAHELGHAYHDRQLFPGGPLMADAPMPLCETASIFNETLTVKKLLEGAPRSEALFLLDQSLINDTQTVVDIY